MAIRTYKVTLDSKNTIAPEPVYLRQGDKTGAVVIDATLMDNGSPVSLSGLTPMFKANTADGQAVIADSTGFNIVNASGGEFTYQVPNALSSVPGKIATAYFSFSDKSGTESTFDVAFIIKKAVDITHAQADDYITIIDGTLDLLNKKMESLQIDLNTILNNYNTGNFYNKSETDSKDNVVLSSSKAYTDSSIYGIKSLPETFANLAAIQSKYPNGANGVMVAADNGHKYIWNGKEWQDAGIYQSVGIADESIKEDYLTSDLRANTVDQVTIKPNILIDQPDQYIMWATGAAMNLVSPEKLYISDFIRLPEIDVYLKNYSRIPVADLRGIAYYDADKNFVSGQGYDATKSAIKISRSNNVRYEFFRFTTEEACLHTVKLVFDELQLRLDQILSNQADINLLRKAINLPPAESILPDMYVSSITGQPADYHPADPATKMTAVMWIKVLPSQTYILSDYASNNAVDIRGYALYDQNKNFLAGYPYDAKRNPITIFTTSDTYYISFTCDTQRINRASVKIADLGAYIRATSTMPDDKPLKTLKDVSGMGAIFRKIIFIGDSLSSGEHEYIKDDGTTGFIDLYPFSFGQQAGRMLNAEAVNLSVGGLTAQANYESYYDAMAKAENIGDLYNIFLGTNDIYKKPYVLGSINDININDATKNANSFYGWYGKIIQRIKAVQPRARITCMTMPQVNNAPQGLTDYNAAIAAIVSLFDHCYLIDLYNYGQPQTANWRKKYGSGMGHLNAMGYRLYAQYFVTYLDWIIKHNYADFMDVGLIGTDYKLSQP